MLDPRLAATTALLTLCAVATSTTAFAATPEDDAPLWQVSIGIMELDDQSADWSDISEDGVDINFATLPSGGIEVEYTLDRGWIHWGINSGGSLSWKTDSTSFKGGFSNDSGAQLDVELDNSLMLVEAHLGGYIRGRLHERITSYAAAGPMVMYGSHEVEDEKLNRTPDPLPPNFTLIDEDSSSAFNLGYYFRAGIDFQVNEKQQLGFGIRYLSAELDFNDTVGNVDIEGTQFLFTYSSSL